MYCDENVPRLDSCGSLAETRRSVAEAGPRSEVWMVRMLEGFRTKLQASISLIGGKLAPTRKS